MVSWIGRAVLACSVATLCASGAASQGAPVTGTLQGSVRAAQTAAPLPYAIVSLPQRSIERFTDASGRFTLLALPVGTYQVVIRRLGFAPYTGTVQVAGGVITPLDVRLVPIPVRLPQMTVRGMTRCERPGVPDATQQPEVFAMVALLRENADRYRLLASQYPFAYLQMRALGEMSRSESPNAEVVLLRVDTVMVRSGTRSDYRPGRVVQRLERPRGGAGATDEYTMAIPTILDLADDSFARNHCFAFGGTSTHESQTRRTETWLRLDVRAADRLRTPDVHGAFYLDSATSQLRRMDLEMSRPDRLPRALSGIAGVEARTSFVEIASGLAVIDRVCSVNRLRSSGRNGRRLLPVEFQQLLAYEFSEAPPDVAPGRVVAQPAWRSGVRLSRSALWCE